MNSFNISERPSQLEKNNRYCLIYLERSCMQIGRRWNKKISRALGCVGTDSYWGAKEGRRRDECLSKEGDVVVGW